MKQINPPAHSAGTDLADLVEEFVALALAGEAADPESFARAHPAYADDLRQLLPAAMALADLGRTSSPIDGAPSGGKLPLSRLGDFRLLREIGRGGMGVVFEAEQMSLGRRVAVKVLPSAAALDARHLQRFKNEAQAAALLRHPHIVPVIAIGQEADTHFFAMQFIDGKSLAALVADLRPWVGRGDRAPTQTATEVSKGPGDTPPPEVPPAAGAAPTAPPPSPANGIGTTDGGTFLSANPIATEKPGRSRAYFRNVARLLVQAAEALDHAHQVGVIHRDVKPGNLLVDNQGELWVTDFGLARLATSPGVTVTGDLLGTVRYMSPEQAQALRVPVDHRTDIYGLGVTAYELLTLRAAFPGEDRQDLLRRIAAEEPPRPRRVNPRVPADLEAIVLKAMEKNPSDRYMTAQELADDLGRFLEDVPVRARRPSAWRTAARWVRRHAGLVMTAGAAAVTISCVLAVMVAMLVISNRRLNEEQAKVKEALDRAKLNAQRANANGRLVREALSDVTLVMADARLKNDRDWVRKAEEVFDKAYMAYEAMAIQDGTNGDINLQKEIAWGFRQVAQLYWHLGSYERALDGYHHSLDLARRLRDANAEDFHPRYIMALCQREMGTIHWQMGKQDEAVSAFRAALAAWVEPKPIPACPFEASLAHASLGEVEEASGHPFEAATHYREAIKLRKDLACAQPKVDMHRNLLADWHRCLGIALLGTGDVGGADTQLRDACELGEQLLAEHKDVGDYHLEVSQSSYLRGRLYETSDPKASARCYRRAAELLSGLASGTPGMPGFRQNLAEVYSRLGMLAYAGGRRSEAAGHFRKVRDLFSALVAAVPGGGPPPGAPGLSENGFAWFLATCPDETFRDVRKAVDLARKAVNRAPAKADYWNTLGAALCRAGNPQEALPALEKAVQLRKETEGTDLFLLAIIHHQLDQPKKAHERYDQGTAWTEQHRAESLELRQLRGEAAALLGPMK
jgi:serine/threonine protein kinase/tetratricopeptide (TPR) repeat protein